MGLTTLTLVMALYKNLDFRRLPIGLSSIFDRRGDQSFFSLPQWYDLMARLGVREGTEVRVYTDERPQSTIALLLQRENDNQRSLASLSGFYTVEHGLIFPPGCDIDRGLAAILGQIASERPRWDCLRLVDLDPIHSNYTAILRALRHAGFLVECRPGTGIWFEATAGMTFSDYLARRPSQLRNTWRRKRRKLDASGGFEASFFFDAADIDRAIADYQTVYDASWKPTEAFPRFIPALMRLAAELGALRLGIYYIGGIPAAAQFWIVWHQRALIYKLAHDRRFDVLSLGTLLTMDMIERVLERDRPLEISLGRGDDPYKKLWLPQRREYWGVLASNPRTSRGLRLGAEREVAKIYHKLRGDRTEPSC